MKINRRDFINGSSIAIIAGLSPLDILAKEPLTSAYPPKLTGLRGSHLGSFENAHTITEKKYDIDSMKIEEKYDLIVVGAGISGLTAAYQYLKKKKNAKILILDNHDDFGGHAKRNEFSSGKTRILGYGGSESIQSPKHFMRGEVKNILTEIGVNIEELGNKFALNFYENLDLDSGIFFDKETFSTDKFVLGDPLHNDNSPDDLSHLNKIINEFPLNTQEIKSLKSFLAEKKDYLPQFSSVYEKVSYLKKTSYRNFLLQDVKLSENIVNIFQQKSHDYFALGIDAINCYDDARNISLPGLDGMDLPPLDLDKQAEVEEPYIYHFPDGNASIARLLVAKLLPKLFPRKMNMHSIILAKINYSLLDLPSSQVRIRLKSTVVTAQNEKDNTVSVGYLDKPLLDSAGKLVKVGNLHKVSAKHVVMAGYNMMIPHIVPELPEKQKAALSLNVKAPMLYSNVLIANWKAFQKLKTHRIYSPSLAYSLINLDFPVSMGNYSHPQDPNKPILLHMVSIPQNNNQGLDARTQFKLGRLKLFTTPFDVLEAEIRNQLQRILEPTGEFSHAKDILAITVNRWPHGYSYSFSPLFDEEEKAQGDMIIAKKKHKNITIANCDAGWNALMHTAMQEAIRAIEEFNL